MYILYMCVFSAGQHIVMFCLRAIGMFMSCQICQFMHEHNPQDSDKLLRMYLMPRYVQKAMS